MDRIYDMSNENDVKKLALMSCLIIDEENPKNNALLMPGNLKITWGNIDLTKHISSITFPKK